MYASAMDQDPLVNISRRLIPEEPMVRHLRRCMLVLSAYLDMGTRLGYGAELGNVT